MNDALKDKVKDLLAEQLGISKAEIGDELAFGDILQWDSLGHMLVMAALESQFGVELSPESISSLTSLPAILETIEAKNHG
jgi:acyl carrier protein